MKRYGLLKCFPCGWGSGNTCLAECRAANMTDAIQLLQPHCSCRLDGNGYGKVDDVSFIVGEFYSA